MSPGLGRFITADHGAGGANPSDPGRWNKYSYTGGDPINRIDRHGNDYQDCDSDGNCWMVFTTEADEMEDSEFEDDPGTPCYGTDPDDPACAEFLSSMGLVSNFYQAPGAPGNNTQGSTPSLQAQLQTAMSLALNALGNPKCAKLLGTGLSQGVAITASQVLSLLYSDNPMYGSISFAPRASQPGSITSAVTMDGINFNGVTTSNTADIVISTSPRSVWMTGNPQQQAILLLHELGHAMNDIFGPKTSGIINDGSNNKAGIMNSMFNTNQITQNCF